MVSEVISEVSEVISESSPLSVSYESTDITVLEGLEAVRVRPGMYIGSTGSSGLHHLVWEVVDNSVDEAMAGHCSQVDVTIHTDGSCEVADNGRGIPVDPHPEHPQTSAVELVMTVLHAGGKFGGSGYRISGGLHGVGVSVVNALSSRLEVEVERSGRRYRMVFVDGGNVDVPFSDVGEAGLQQDGSVRSGTRIRFWPDSTIFEETRFRYQTLFERLQMMSFLNQGLRITLNTTAETPERVADTAELTAQTSELTADRPEHTAQTAERTADTNELAETAMGSVSFCYEGGIRDYVSHLNRSKEPLFDSVGHFTGAELIDGQPHELEVAFQWNTGFHADGLHSFANGIATTEGGMHEHGFRAAFTRTLNAYARDKNYLKDSQGSFQGTDVREGLTAIISCRLASPQFEGQTKTKLGNTSMRSLVERVTNVALREWLEEHPAESRKIILKAAASARAREAAARVRSEIRSKSLLDGAGMPDKLKDCSTTDPAQRELFIVEGDSAGGSAIRARNPVTQAVLPIRGKILNVERARIDRMLKNNEIKALITAIGAGFASGFGMNGSAAGKSNLDTRLSESDSGFNLEQVRYHKVILLADADVDGSHIRTLLLTFFFRQMLDLLKAGFVYVAQPPLYSTKISNSKTHYLLDDDAKNAFLAERPNHKKEFQRLKGLGEMDWQELRDTTMDPKSRSLLRVSIAQAAIADEVTSILMGDDVARRRDFIVTNAREVRNLDF